MSKPNTENIDKLFLELSQFASVITDNESKLIDKNRRVMEYVQHKEIGIKYKIIRNKL